MNQRQAIIARRISRATNRRNARRVARIHGKHIARIHACIDNVVTALAWAGLASGALVMLAMVAHGLVQS